MICSQGEWYTLCGDTNSWTQTQARVACRQMGLNPNGMLVVHKILCIHFHFVIDLYTTVIIEVKMYICHIPECMMEYLPIQYKH